MAPDDKFVLCPIRLDPHKGAETFIDAAALVKNRLGAQGLVFAIAGSGDSAYRTKLEKQAREQGVENVVRLGATDGVDFLPDEMPTLYRRATLCVLPSRREGFGQVLLEASAFKCPVLGANTGGIPELIKPYETGLLFNRDEPHDLADQLCTLLQDANLRVLVARRAFEELRRRFDAETMARRYLELYLDVTGISIN